jgi:hypothetical protein
MAGVLTNVAKGSMLDNADNRLRKRTGETAADYKDRLDELLGWLKLGQMAMPLVKHAKTLTVKGKDKKVAEDATQEKHTSDEFFGDNPAQCFFPGMAGDSEDEIVRGAYIQAIELAKVSSPPKPIVSYWIINGRKATDPDGFEVFVSETDLEVHVLLLTPMPVNVPEPPDVGRPEDMYVISTTQRVLDIDQSWPNKPGYPRKRVTMSGTVGVDCMRVMGY